MKLTIKNFESLENKKWDDRNFIEGIKEDRDEYSISCWRGHLRKLVVLKREPEPNGYYEIGEFDTTTGVSSVTQPYWIKLEDIENQTTFMSKLKLLTDYWEPKLI